MDIINYKHKSYAWPTLTRNPMTRIDFQ